MLMGRPRKALTREALLNLHFRQLRNSKVKEATSASSTFFDCQNALNTETSSLAYRPLATPTSRCSCMASFVRQDELGLVRKGRITCSRGAFSLYKHFHRKCFKHRFLGVLSQLLSLECLTHVMKRAQIRGNFSNSADHRNPVIIRHGSGE